jgi:hypothetical protein
MIYMAIGDVVTCKVARQYWDLAAISKRNGEIKVVNLTIASKVGAVIPEISRSTRVNTNKECKCRWSNEVTVSYICEAARSRVRST